MTKKTLKKLFIEFGKLDKDAHLDIHNDDDFYEDASIFCYGTDWFLLSEEHLKALNAGKVLHLSVNGGEYQMFIKRGKNDQETDQTTGKEGQRVGKSKSRT